jgi:hypothetical protein
VAVEAAEEVVDAGAERDAVVPGAVRVAGGLAPVVAAGVHRHHVVHGGVVVEHCASRVRGRTAREMNESKMLAWAPSCHYAWNTVTYRARPQRGSSCPGTSCRH